MIRQAYAAEFYAGDCAGMTDQFLQDFSPPTEPTHIFGGVVPHAGWMYSGAIAAQVFGAIHSRQDVDSFVLFGAIHRWSGRNAVFAHGSWSTPLGPVEIDEELARGILDSAGGILADDAPAHAGEHAIEVQLPFIKYLFPTAGVVPISVNPDTSAVEIGNRIGELVRTLQRQVVIVGSTDLTHYGEPYQFTPMGSGERARKWMHRNDQRMVELALNMEAARIVPESRLHQNACGAGALAATVAAVKQLGASRGNLLAYRTSFDVAPDPTFHMAVGYAGIVF